MNYLPQSLLRSNLFSVLAIIVETEESPVIFTIVLNISKGLSIPRIRAREKTRELSLVHTKLDEAEITLDKAIDIELSRRSFWEYEKYINRSFFLENRWHLKELAITLEKLYRGELLKPDGTPYSKLIINLPPRLGKTYTIINNCQWMLGDNNENRIITVSYNEILSGRLSKAVRGGIEIVSVGDLPCFVDVFPDTKIKQGDAAAGLWSLEGQHFNYLGGSPGGTIIGMGGNIGIIDDLIKNEYEANNDETREKHWRFYTDTFLSRLEKGAIQIVVATRWHKEDLCGRLLKAEPGEWYVLSREAMRDGKMLCNDLLNMKDYLSKKALMGDEIFSANYHQEPIDIKGKLYKTLKTYTDLPQGVIKNYTDTADQGNDYLCSIDYIEYQKEAFVVDVTYTKEGMEVTEPQTAKMLKRDGVTVARIESNNGGRGFARAVERISKEIGNYVVKVQWFHQSKNKNARILSGSAWVQEHIYFPHNWNDRWPVFYKDVTTYQKEGKNKHDDAPDVLTGIFENVSSRRKMIY